MSRKAKTTEVRGDVQSVDHVSASHSGNPTYRVTLTDGQSFLTETDYGIPAGNFRPHSLRLPVSPVVLTLNSRGRIVKMARPETRMAADCGHEVVVPWTGPTGYSRYTEMPEIPADYPVQPVTSITPGDRDIATCGTCGRSWNDAISTSMTPTPAGRCPFEGFHSREVTACYSCSDEMEREAFRTADVFTAYVDSKGDRLTTWPGGHLAINTGHTKARTGFNGSVVHRWWFQDRQGGRWYGQNAGPGMVINVRRVKGD